MSATSAAPKVQSIPGPSFISNFPMGESIQLECGGKKFLSVLRGAYPPNYLFTDIPRLQGKETFVSSIFNYHARASVRFLFHGSIYGFTTRIKSAGTNPAILVMEYPQSIEKIELRKNERISLMIPTKANVNGHPHPISASIMDFSHGGAGLTVNSEVEIKVNDKVALSLVLPDGKPVQSLKCDVKSLFSLPPNTNLGISFDAQNNGSLAPVVDFYNKCLPFNKAFSSLKNKDEMRKKKIFHTGQEISIEFNKKKVVSILRAWKLGKNGYIFVDQFPQQIMLSDVKPGLQAIARFEVDGRIYGMEILFVKVLKESRVLVFRTQDNVAAHSLRSEQRFQCMIPVVLTEEGLGTREGMISCLSTGGIRVLSKNPLPKNQSYCMNFSLSEVGPIESQKFRIARSNEVNGLYEYAGPFVKSDTNIEKKLQLFLENRKNC